MLDRRFLLTSAPALIAAPALAESGSFAAFVNSVRADARRAGISAMTLDAAFAGVAPNEKVLERDRHQPEFTMTWARYRALVVPAKRITDGRAIVAKLGDLPRRVEDRFGVPSGIVTGIWGLESSFGQITGDFRVVEALATLGWEGRRASFFRGELMAALKILEQGDIAPGKMTGSYAGAMGQPQFMPTSYLSYAVDFEGHGRRDIWTSKPDVLGSIGNYLARSGWRRGETWGQQVIVPPDQPPANARDAKKPLSEWTRQGVRPMSGRWVAPDSTPAGAVLPDGPSGEAFLVFANFGAIRRYNPSDFYALAVGLLADGLTG